MKHRWLWNGLWSCLLAFGALGAQKPSVLFVGNDPVTGPPDWELQASQNPERLKKLYAERMPAFKALLEQNFDKVVAIDSAKYTPEMSDRYDVTIFDALPPELPITQGMKDELTGSPIQAYLPRNFSRPAILIGVNGARIGAFLGLKINQHCDCLDAQAHGMKPNHEIFNQPVRVPLTLEQVKTPDNYPHYYSGRNLPATMTMWRVQTEGFKDGNGFPVGLVSTGPGFEDSPDAEVISNGVNSKAANSVALARHGNFFMWGFSGSPTYMTPEAKQVFVNAIYYIRKFDGQTPFVRVKRYTYSRDFLLDALGDVMNGDLHKMYQQQLAYPPQARVDNEADFLALAYKVPREVAQKFGFDGNAYLEYHASRLEYYRPVAGKHLRFEVDPDVQSLGISNRDVKLLDACVTMLEHDDRAEMARRILLRYTEQTFTTATKWRQWLETNRTRIFFTDLGGFHFLVYPGQPAPDSREYTISGDASATTKQGTAKLWRFGEGMEIEEIASVPIDDGKFRFHGTVDWISAAGVSILVAEKVDRTLAKIDLILEPGKTRIVMRPNTAAEIDGGPYFRKVFGSWQQDPRYVAAAKKSAEIMARIDDKMPQAESSKLRAEGLKYYLEALGIESDILGKLYASDPDPLARFLLLQESAMASAMGGKPQDTKTRIATLEALQKELPGYPPIVRAIGRIKEVQERQANAEAIKPGAVISDFSAPDIDGKNFHLSEVFKQQKYVLVEFWASWCGPCRAEIPNLKQAYSSFHDKGFEIVSFSLDDKVDAWRKASNEEKLPWVNTSDLKAFGSPIIKMFGVLGVPANYLVDRKGTIVAMNLRGKELEKRLGELL